MNRKAFTLIELLIVVVIISVLASFVRPQFHKMVETYKALGAERVMAAVRGEQMTRCMLDKDYTMIARKLVAIPSHSSANFSYQLTATGIKAASLNRDYTLVMKSYQTGGICCYAQDGINEGYCPHLVRHYPRCSEYEVVDQTGCDAPTE